MNLNDLKPGQRAVVKNISGEGAIRRHIIDMGITPGTVIIMRKSAPFGDPIQINVRGYGLSIRKREATNIKVIIKDGDEDE